MRNEEAGARGKHTGLKMYCSTVRLLVFSEVLAEDSKVVSGPLTKRLNFRNQND